MIETRTVKLVSDAAGAAVATVVADGGKVIGVEIRNDVEPTDSWDVKIETAMGTKIYENTALSNSATTYAVPLISGTNSDFQYAVVGKLTVTAAAMGDTKAATLVIYLEK